MRAIKIGMLAVCLLIACSAQSQITAVVNAASGLPVAGHDMLISIYGTGLAPAGCTASANSLPWPFNLCGVSVELERDDQSLCPTGLSVLYVSPTLINAYYPVIVPEQPYCPFGTDGGPLKVRWYVGGNAYGADYQIDTGGGGPGIFVSGTDCTLFDPGYPAQLGACPASEQVLRGSITDLSGKLISQSNPASINEYLILWGTGVYGLNSITLFKPAPLHIGSAVIVMPMTNQPASVTYSGPSGYPGVDQVNLLIKTNSANFPCGMDTKLEADLGFVALPGQQTNRVTLPIFVKAAQVPCKP